LESKEKTGRGHIAWIAQKLGDATNPAMRPVDCQCCRDLDFGPCIGGILRNVKMGNTHSPVTEAQAMDISWCCFVHLFWDSFTFAVFL
jgi:hypothetical protein